MSSFILNDGHVVLVDDCDDHWLLTYKYKVRYLSTDNRPYVTRLELRTGRLCRLHSDILQAKKGEIVDHKDGNGLNNTRSNIRIATHSQNRANAKALYGRKYKGVSWMKHRNKWRAVIKYQHLGCFDTEIEAARAYNEAAIKHFGEFAKLNEID